MVRRPARALVMTQEVLMERLCALVPRPRMHLVTYHGVLAPASGLRSRVVPRREGDVGVAGGCRHGDGDGVAAVASADLDEAVVAERQRRQRLRVPHGCGRRSGARRRLPWAALLSGCSECRCWSARSAPDRGGCWRRSTTRRRLRGCWGRRGCLDRNRGRLSAGRRRVAQAVDWAASPAGRSDGEVWRQRGGCGEGGVYPLGRKAVRGGGLQPFARACRRRPVLHDGARGLSHEMPARWEMVQSAR